MNLTGENLRYLAPFMFPLCSPHFTLKFSLFIEHKVMCFSQETLSDDYCSVLLTVYFFIFNLKMVYVCARECSCPLRELDTASCIFCLYKRGGMGISCVPLCSQRVQYRNQMHTLNQTLFRIFQKNILRTDKQHLFKKHKHLIIVKSQILISLHSPSRSLLFLSSDKSIITSLESIQLKPSNL